jgi:hypothetical protein
VEPNDNYTETGEVIEDVINIEYDSENHWLRRKDVVTA